MNYTSITDKPFINTKPGPSIRLCAACLDKKYTNEPPAMRKLACACDVCGEGAMCQEIEKARLVKRAPKKRKPKPVPVRVQFNIISRQIRVDD